MMTPRTFTLDSYGHKVPWGERYYVVQAVAGHRTSAQLSMCERCWHERDGAVDLLPEDVGFSWEDGWRLLESIAAAHGLTARHITGPSRRAPIVAARHEAARALRERGWKLEAIATMLRRDHSTIVHALRKATGYE